MYCVVDIDIGTSAGGGQIVDEKAILDDGGSAVTWTANAPLYLIQNSHGHAANQFVSTATGNVQDVVYGKFAGIVSHYHCSKKKIDCAGLDIKELMEEADMFPQIEEAK